MLKSSFPLFVAILISLCCHSAYADIYEYIDEAGISHYSDTPNSGTDGNDNYVLILKSEVEVKPEIAKAEAVADNPNTTASTNSLTLTRPVTPNQLLAQIAQSALNNQIDGELIHAVMHVESAYKVKAKSHKGAQGLMQLMPATASRLGVKNSFDPAQNIEGGAKYLRELLTLFNNDITLTIAAYNAGENAVIWTSPDLVDRR
jgi:Transglycosylase SLT domain/Domain of unknown function (DUF4124)